METVIFAIICAVLIIIGLLGVILPFVPGIPVAWLGLFIYAIGTDWERISITTIIVFAALTVFALLLDYIAPLLGAKKYKAASGGLSVHHRLFWALLSFKCGPLYSARCWERSSEN
jgi:uncharacterized protein YqgC (DUF456 family)